MTDNKYEDNLYVKKLSEVQYPDPDDQSIKTGPDTITLTNVRSRLNYHDVLIPVTNYETPWSTVWEHDGHYYNMVRLCRGHYKKGMKKNQMCLKSSGWIDGYCPKHRDQKQDEESEDTRESTSSESE